MSKINDEPAFPWGNDVRGGMSLRDYFAVHVSITRDNLQSDLMKFVLNDTPPPPMTYKAALWDIEAEARIRYLKADAMLAARMERKRLEFV